MFTFTRKFAFQHLALGTMLALSLIGCGSDDPSSTSQANSLVSSAATQPFMMNGVPVTFAQAGVEYRYQPQATNPTGRALSYNVVNKPDWALFNETTGELSGTPAQSDIGTSANIEIGVSDGTTTATVGPFRIRVTAEGRTSSATAQLAITGSPASSVSAGEVYRFVPTVANAQGQTLSFSILNRPTWAVFNPATGLLVGTPKADNAGAYHNILISVSSGAAPVSLQAFSIQVQGEGSEAPTISGSPATTVSEGASYSFTPSVTDPSGNALTYSIANLPAWASFNAATGELSGTAPMAAQTSANILISVSNGTDSASLAPFSLSVEASSGGGGGTNGGSIKFHPGMYVELDPGSGGGGLSGWLSTIASLKNSQGVVGVMLIQPWSALEFAEGVYTGGSAQGRASTWSISSSPPVRPQACSSSSATRIAPSVARRTTPPPPPTASCPTTSIPSRTAAPATSMPLGHYLPG